jgi:hypothetical protein
MTDAWENVIIAAAVLFQGEQTKEAGQNPIAARPETDRNPTGPTATHRKLCGSAETTRAVMG